MTIKKLVRSEYVVQVQLIRWLRWKYNDEILFTIAPQGMKLSIGVAKKLKEMGYSKGTPDLMIFEPRGKYHGFFLELKTEQGSLMKEQKKWLQELQARGYKTDIAYGFDEAQKKIETYFKENMII
jgi:hypothetical protein